MEVTHQPAVSTGNQPLRRTAEVAADAWGQPALTTVSRSHASGCKQVNHLGEGWRLWPPPILILPGLRDAHRASQNFRPLLPLFSCDDTQTLRHTEPLGRPTIDAVMSAMALTRLKCCAASQQIRPKILTGFLSLDNSTCSECIQKLVPTVRFSSSSICHSSLLYTVCSGSTS